jgi:hypothetical protein
MTGARFAAALLIAGEVACVKPTEAPAPPPAASVASTSTSGAAMSTSSPSPCSADGECGYDPTSNRCGNDPRFNKQPPVIDQGIICYCDDRARVCQMLRVWPVPCEGDASCAVNLEPRPHPVPATREHPHERGKPCVDFAYSTTCERTNICTMHDLGCRDGGAR